MLYDVETQTRHILVRPSKFFLVVSQQSYQFISDVPGHASADLDFLSFFPKFTTFVSSWCGFTSLSSFFTSLKPSPNNRVGTNKLH